MNHDELARRSDPNRRSLIVDQTFITVPVEPDVERVMSEWVAAHLDDLAARLEPCGLIPGDLAVPEWHRLVYVEAVNQ